MWFTYVVIHTFLLALVNYIDEKLATNNNLPKRHNIHTKVGSVLLMSTIMCFFGAFIAFLITHGQIYLDNQTKIIALSSSIPIVIMYASYFYLLQMYPAHQVLPLFQISSIWLIIISYIFGEQIGTKDLIGIAVLMYGAYILDSGTFNFKVPTKLLIISVPASSVWAIALYMVRYASKTGSTSGITFWQMIGIATIGIALFVFIKVYRESFIYRIKHQNKKFLGFSFANEAFAELGYAFSNIAVAIAPVAAYITAMSGLQSIFLMILFILFPQTQRTKVTRMQWVAVILISIGVFILEIKYYYYLNCFIFNW